jgi:hypothetical protein
LKRIKGRNLGELRAKSRQTQDHPQLRNDLVEYLQEELTGTGMGTATGTTSISEQQEQQQQDDDDEEALQLDRELAEAHETLQRLESKQEFVGRRLGSYQKALALKEAKAAAAASSANLTEHCRRRPHGKNSSGTAPNLGPSKRPTRK